MGILAILKANKAIIVGIIILAIFGVGLWLGIKMFRGEMLRMENNYLAAVEQLRGDNKEAQRVYELKIGELQRQFPELKKQLEDMNIKLKNVVSVENINTITDTKINTHIRDTIVYDTIPAKVAVYKDKWTDFKIIEIGNDLQAHIVTQDSIVCVLNRVKRTFAEWWRRDPKQVRNTIKNFNPNSKITYNRLIQIEK